MGSKRLTRLDIKHAILSNVKFRELFPELEKEIKEVISNPSCPCHIPTYDLFFRYKDRLQQYFSMKEIKSPQEEAEDESQNNWSVINCKAHELEDVLNKLHKQGRLQIAIARFENEITLVVNSLGIAY